MLTANPQIGNDPELFVKNGNRIVPSEGILTSSHKKIKVDNAAIELQPGPSHCLQVQNKYIGLALTTVERILRKYPKYKI